MVLVVGDLQQAAAQAVVGQHQEYRLQHVHSLDRQWSRQRWSAFDAQELSEWETRPRTQMIWPWLPEEAGYPAIQSQRTAGVVRLVHSKRTAGWRRCRNMHRDSKRPRSTDFKHVNDTLTSENIHTHW